MMKRIVFLFILAGVFCSSALAKGGRETVVFVVRHGEKDLSNPRNANPPLSAEGSARAQDLALELNKVRVDAVFSTDFLRTKSTVEPTAKQNNQSIGVYNAATPKVLADEVRGKYAGKIVLIAGHSNTILEMVEAFGVSRPVKELTEEDYHFLFKITINRKGEAKLSTRYYGKPHHITQLNHP